MQRVPCRVLRNLEVLRFAWRGYRPSGDMPSGAGRSAGDRSGVRARRRRVLEHRGTLLRASGTQGAWVCGLNNSRHAWSI